LVLPRLTPCARHDTLSTVTTTHPEPGARSATSELAGSFTELALPAPRHRPAERAPVPSTEGQANLHGTARHLLDVVTDPDALEVPPHLTVEEARGFALATGKILLGRGVGDMIHPARTNLRNIAAV
jgi:hypothetical protein